MFPASLADGDFRLPTEGYYAAVLDLSMRVLEILAKGLPYGDDIFHEFVSNDPVCIMRLLHYPPQQAEPPRDQRQLGAGAHTDFGTSSLSAVLLLLLVLLLWCCDGGDGDATIMIMIISYTHLSFPPFYECLPPPQYTPNPFPN